MNPLLAQEQYATYTCVFFLFICFLLSPFTDNNETFGNHEVKRISLLKYNLVYKKNPPGAKLLGAAAHKGRFVSYGMETKGLVWKVQQAEV